MIWLSKEFNSHSSVIMLKHQFYIDNMISWFSDMNHIWIISYDVYHMHLRWAINWCTTSNHCDRSWGDCTMPRSSLSQVSNILPISVFVFGDCWYSTRWTTCIAANDQDTFICWSRCICWYSENLFYTLAISKIVIELSTLKIYIPIAIWKWIIGQLYPFLCFHMKNFGLQSIIVRRLTGYKWWVLVRSKRIDIFMGEFWWWFCFEGFSIETKKSTRWCQWIL